MDNSEIICRHVIDADVDAEAKSNNDTKSHNETKRKQPVKHKISVFCLYFYSVL